MQLAARMYVAPMLDPIAWVRLSIGGTLDAAAEASHPEAFVVHDGGATWSADASHVRDGVDATRALREARLGVNELVATVEGATPFLAPFARPVDGGATGEPSMVDIVLRRVSGAQEHYVVPLASAPAALGDAVSSVRHLSGVARAYFRADTQPQG
jgi:hypothetical protein